MWAVYGPVYAYWLLLCARARSFFFFNAANPGITNGGFLMESKMDIYDQLPQGSYPTTLRFPANSALAAVRAEAAEAGLRFPLIAKPDIGLRGLGVVLLRNARDLARYHRHSGVAFLLQAYADLPGEAGIFWCRLPGEAEGRITGIVDKELLHVRGDGRSSIRTLLQRSDRALLQLPALDVLLGDVLNEVLPAGTERLLVPFGNHSRGALFRDRSAWATPALGAAINELCCRVPGFYFGRLDIRYRSVEALQRGEDFTIIELNGAGAEPAHIYDPGHSLWFAWKEIIRHWNWLYRISRANRRHSGTPYLSAAEGWRMLRANSRHSDLIRKLNTAAV